MPKVVHIVLGKANPLRLNGVNKVVYSIATEATRAGHDVMVWGLTARPDSNTVLPFPIRLFQYTRYRLFINRSMRDAIDALPSDTIFHLHGSLIPIYFSLTRWLLKQGKRYIITPHGCLLEQSLRRGSWYKRPYIHLIEKRVLKDAYCVHCITDHEKDDIHFISPHIQTAVIPNGAVPQAEIQATQSGQIRFLYMGRFALDHKGLDRLISSFAGFYQTYKTGMLLLVGCGADQQKLQSLIEHYHVKDQVQFVSPQFGADKAELLANSDVFIHLSRWDVLPTACLEAAATGKPLIVTTATGFAPYINKYNSGWSTGSLLSDIQHTLAKAYHAWQTGDLAAIGQNARQMIDTELNWPVITQRFYMDIYNHAAA